MSGGAGVAKITIMKTQTLMTAEEFLALPGEVPRELVRGEVVEMSPPGARHGVVCANITMLLKNWARGKQAGAVLSNDAAVVTERDPDTVRGPDVQFIAVGRLGPDFPPTGSLEIPPDLVIEVVSESDRWHDVITKVDEFLDAGVQEVWVVDPKGQFVEVFRTESRPRRIDLGGEIESPQILPGFRCSVSEFFAVF